MGLREAAIDHATAGDLRLAIELAELLRPEIPAGEPAECAVLIPAGVPQLLRRWLFCLRPPQRLDGVGIGPPEGGGAELGLDPDLPASTFADVEPRCIVWSDIPEEVGRVTFELRHIHVSASSHLK